MEKIGKHKLEFWGDYEAIEDPKEVRFLFPIPLPFIELLTHACLSDHQLEEYR